MKNKTKEHGRSMVEMLGVLAVIGVLSVGGIAGYKYAMDRYKANEWINNYQIFLTELKAYENQMDGRPFHFFELNGYKLYYTPRDFYFPTVHNARVCKMIFETINPYEDIGVGRLYLRLGNASDSQCSLPYDIECARMLCERGTNFEGEGIMGI